MKIFLKFLHKSISKKFAKSVKKPFLCIRQKQYEDSFFNYISFFSYD